MPLESKEYKHSVSQRMMNRTHFGVLVVSYAQFCVKNSLRVVTVVLNWMSLSYYPTRKSTPKIRNHPETR